MMIRKFFFLSVVLFISKCNFAVDPIDFTKRADTIESKNFSSFYNNSFNIKPYENDITETQYYQNSKNLYKNKMAPIDEQKFQNNILQLRDIIQFNNLFNKQDYPKIQTNTIETSFYKRFLSKFWNKTENAEIVPFYNSNYDLITKEISLQSINRFAFRRNHSLEPTLPTQEAGKE